MVLLLVCGRDKLGMHQEVFEVSGAVRDNNVFFFVFFSP